jgi:pimeloyl-ACP methyl ester carboxylesterase
VSARPIPNPHRPHRGPLARCGALAILALVVAVPPALEAGPAPAAPAPREVVVRTADGLDLRAAYHPAATPGGAGVVLLPMFKSDRMAWDKVLAPLRDRGVHVLAIDPRGHGRSAKPGKTDLAPLVEKRDGKLFAAMHADAITAVRWLVKEAACDAKRVVLVGGSVGGSVAVDTASRYPGEVAGVAWLSPGAKYLGLDTLAAIPKIPAGLPVLLLVHKGEWELARPVAEALPRARVVVYDDPPPTEAGAERAWAHGTRMLRHLPLVERTVASFVAVATGSKTEDVVLDGVVTTSGPNADPWDRAVEVGVGAGEGTLRAFRVGRRIVFGGTAGPGTKGLRFEVQTGTPQSGENAPPLGPPQVVAVDLGSNEIAWTWGGMGSVPNFPGIDMGPMFGKTYPTLRAVPGENGLTFEGEWFIPEFLGDSPAIHLVVSFSEVPPDPPRGGVESFGEFAVDLPSR